MINGKVAKLESQLSSNLGKTSAAKTKMIEAQWAYNLLLKEQEKIRAELDAATNPSRISDHAVLRYAERIYGFEMEAVRMEIMDKVSTAIELGASSATVNNVKFKIKDNCVTTVIT